MTAVAVQPVEAGPRGRVAGRESRRGARSLPPAALPEVPVVLPAGQQVRPDAVSWPQTEASRAETGARLLEIAGQPGGSLPLHRMSVRRLLDWLEAQPGSTWQQRWQASGAEQAGKDWAAQLAGTGRHGGGTADQDVIKAGMMLLLAGQVIRPGLEWLLEQPYYKTLAVAFTQIDPAGLDALQRAHAARGVGGSFSAARNVIARIMICKGGPVTAVTAGDCAWYWHTRRERGKPMNEGGLFYALLFETGIFGPDAPPTLMAATRRGQLSCAGLIDRYQIECAPIRDVLVDYLAVRRPAVDYTSLDNLARNLGMLFWRDLELHQPCISSLHLPAEVATAWKLRLQVISHDPRRAGQQRKVPENTLMHVRAFYADLAAWAAEDPVRWGRFGAPSPVRASEITFTKIRRHRKAAMDQRTRTLAPVLPALVRQVRDDLDRARQRLHAALQVSDGREFTVAGVTWRRHDSGSGSGRIYGIGPGGRRLDLARDEERAFWTWASVEVLRHTGVRIEEMLELTHHSFCAYTLPTTGEVVPMLQVAPSKTDSERLLLVSPELGEVLAEVINRVRGTARSLPLAARWDGFERRWSPLMPFLFQRPDGGVHKPVTRRFVASALDRAMAAAGLTGPDGQQLRITPHDFRRIFATDALRAVLPPHIAAKILGHIDLNTTMGYVAIYPEDVITGHRAFIARRRALRPGEEYRDLSPAEWDEFLGHFELRKVELGVCTRDFGTPCVHEHACIRCPALRRTRLSGTGWQISWPACAPAWPRPASKAGAAGHGPARRPAPGHPPGHARLPAQHWPLVRPWRRAMNLVLVASLAAAGLAAGPGQRAVIFRYAVPAGEPPRRSCPACGQQLTAARKMALALLARCPACGQNTGPPPLIIELSTAVLLGALAARVHPGLVLAAACWLALCAVPLAFIDAAVRRLPDALTGAAVAGSALLLLAFAAASGDWHVLVRAVLGGVALSGFYLVLVLVSPSGMGMGDVKAAAGLGTMLAWRGWGALIVGGFAGFLLAAVYASALLISGRATRKYQIPFGPFMFTGAFLVVLAWHS